MQLLSWVQVGFAGTVAGVIGLGALSNSVPAQEPVRLADSKATGINSKATKIDVAQIRKILDEMQVAAKKQDTEALVKYLAPDVEIDMTIQSLVGTQTLRLNREQYRQYLEQGFGITQDYSGKYSNLNVQVAANGKTASATYTLVEEVVMKDSAIAITSSTNSLIQFELIQGQILATQLKSTSKVDLK
ncbi:MAG: nuclear transport factor 2 family protein [Leptolyngbyaceae cyanobacterium RU_5_1]|nr:nuclear transport factor 2 family protein [Leptolyngbyaceae cyanobacterium RU_5_1]